MKRIVSIIILILVQGFAFASIYLGNANDDQKDSNGTKKIVSTQTTTSNFFVDVFENENEDETELDYHLLQFPLILFLNFDIVNALTASFVFPQQNNESTLSKCAVFILNRQILI